MLTEIGHVVMHVRDFGACRAVYGADLGLKEMAYTVDPGGRQISAMAIGPSILELHEDPEAVTRVLPSGQLLDLRSIPGSVIHFAFLTHSNDAVYVLLKKTGIALATRDGPEVQPPGHGLMQRSLLQFNDPSGLVVQIAELVDPRAEIQQRRAAKEARLKAGSFSVLLQGFDHIKIDSGDARASQEFFGRDLGLAEVAHRSGAGGADLRVFAVGMTDLELATAGGPIRPALGPGTVTALGFWTEDVDRAYHSLRARGVAIGQAPSEHSVLPGIRKRFFTVMSPDGLPVEIAQRM